MSGTSTPNPHFQKWTETKLNERQVTETNMRDNETIDAEYDHIDDKISRI